MKLVMILRLFLPLLLFLIWRQAQATAPNSYCQNPMDICSKPSVVKLRQILEERKSKKLFSATENQNRFLRQAFYEVKNQFLEKLSQRGYYEKLWKLRSEDETSLLSQGHYTLNGADLFDKSSSQILDNSIQDVLETSNFNAYNVRKYISEKLAYGVLVKNFGLIAHPQFEYLLKHILRHEMAHNFDPARFFVKFDPFKNHNYKFYKFSSEMYPFNDYIQDLETLRPMGFSRACVRKIERKFAKELLLAPYYEETLKLCISRKRTRCEDSRAKEGCKPREIVNYCVQKEKIDRSVIDLARNFLEIQQLRFAEPTGILLKMDDCGDFKGPEIFADYFAFKLDLESVNTAKEIITFIESYAAYLCPEQNSKIRKERLNAKQMIRSKGLKIDSSHPSSAERISLLFNFKKVREAFQCPIKKNNW